MARTQPQTKRRPAAAKKFPRRIASATSSPHAIKTRQSEEYGEDLDSYRANQWIFDTQWLKILLRFFC
ncbi:8294_t:CDS:2 [Entrophospora sp. SA101]|nr:8294_t:CDS:2 [Entrophospora sp. SA101]